MIKIRNVFSNILRTITAARVYLVSRPVIGRESAIIWIRIGMVVAGQQPFSVPDDPLMAIISKINNV